MTQSGTQSLVYHRVNTVRKHEKCEFWLQANGGENVHRPCSSISDGDSSMATNTLVGISQSPKENKIQCSMKPISLSFKLTRAMLSFRNNFKIRH